MKKLLFLFLLIPFVSCQKEEPNNLPGYYDIISMESEIALDLDGDGIAQKDLYDELLENNVEILNTHSTIGPKKEQPKSEKYMFFLGVYRQQYDKWSDNYYYGSGCMMCSYDFLPDGTLVVINDNYEFNSERQGDIISLKWDGKDQLTGVFRLRYYIIEEDRWVSPLVTIVFQRVIVKGGDF